jgi:hypothetical protein
VQPSNSNSSGEFAPPIRFGDGVFRLCSHFNYHSKVEVSKITKAISHSVDKETKRHELNLDFEEKRMATEAVQNAELLAKLSRNFPGESREAIRYGDVVQLQHVRSGLFMAVHKTPAPSDPNCRKVSLKAGSRAAHLKILPKYKVRSIGSLVYADDQIVLQSVKNEFLFVGASSGASESGPLSDAEDSQVESIETQTPQATNSGIAAAVPPLHLRVPAVLRREANIEINGSTEVRSLAIKLYHGQSEHHGSLLSVSLNFYLNINTHRKVLTYSLIDTRASTGFACFTQKQILSCKLHLIPIKETFWTLLGPTKTRCASSDLVERQRIFHT